MTFQCQCSILIIIRSMDYEDDDILSRADEVAQTIHQQCRQGDRYVIVDCPIPVQDLRRNMVWQDGARPRVITGVASNRQSGTVRIETASLTLEVPADSQIPVWYIFENGSEKPFMMELPDLPAMLLPSKKGGSTLQAYDAAGVVPRLLPPKRVM